MTKTDRPPSEKAPSPAVARAAATLDLVAAEPSRLTLTDLAERLGLAKSSVHALTKTLIQLGLLTRLPDQTFTMGPHVMRWAASFSRRSDLTVEFARIWDENTVQLHGETATLSILDGNDVVYIGARNSARTPWFDFRVGKRLPMAFTATGQAFMSRMRDDEIRHRFRNGLPAPMTPHSPTTLDAVPELVAAARARGYALDEEYVSEGMVCFGAPVLGAANRTVAGIAVSLPAVARSEATDAKVVRCLLQMANTVSERLGAEIENHTDVESGP